MRKSSPFLLASLAAATLSIPGSSLSFASVSNTDDVGRREFSRRREYNSSGSRSGGMLGFGCAEGEEFADARGRRYVRTKGTIRRVK